MKQCIAMLLCLMLFFTAGCVQDTPETTISTTMEQETTVPPTTLPPETTVPPTTVPPTTVPETTAPPVPETVSGTALADHTVFVMTTLARDTQVEIVGEYNEAYYIVKLDQGYGLIAKPLVRMEGAEAYKQWQGYAKSNAKFYDNYHLIPGNETKQKKNTKIQVLEDLGESLLVQVGETVGYMRTEEVSTKKVQSSGGNSGGNSGGSDGGDISLDNQEVIFLSTVVPQEGEVSGKATVLADNAEVIYGWFDRDEKFDIITEPGFLDEKDGWHGVYLNGLYGYVRKNLTAQEGAEAYEQWQGYAKKNAPLFDNYYLSGKQIKKLSVNTKVQVICDLEWCYLVQIGEEFGYLAKDKVSQTKIKTGSGGGSSNSGGGDWTPPAM